MCSSDLAVSEYQFLLIIMYIMRNKSALCFANIDKNPSYKFVRIKNKKMRKRIVFTWLNSKIGI